MSNVVLKNKWSNWQWTLSIDTKGMQSHMPAKKSPHSPWVYCRKLPLVHRSCINKNKMAHYVCDSANKSALMLCTMSISQRGDGKIIIFHGPKEFVFKAIIRNSHTVLALEPPLDRSSVFHQNDHNLTSESKFVLKLGTLE